MPLMDSSVLQVGSFDLWPVRVEDSLRSSDSDSDSSINLLSEFYNTLITDADDLLPMLLKC